MRVRVRGGVIALVLAALLGVNTSSAAAPKLGHGTVVTVAGHPISKRTIAHWMFVVAKSDSSQKGGGPVIAPASPPHFDGCVRAVRARERHFAHTSRRRLRSHCRRLFLRQSRVALDFLIKAHWYEDLASADHIRITQRRVLRAFRRAKRQQFPTRSQFRTFLRQTGQTVKDILFRFRANLSFQLLLKRMHQKSFDRAVRKLEAQVRRRYLPATRCARYYVIRDCANFMPRRQH